MRGFLKTFEFFEHRVRNLISLWCLLIGLVAYYLLLASVYQLLLQLLIAECGLVLEAPLVSFFNFCVSLGEFVKMLTFIYFFSQS